MFFFHFCLFVRHSPAIFAYCQNSLAEQLSMVTWQNKIGELGPPWQEKMLAGKDWILAGRNGLPPSENDPATSLKMTWYVNGPSVQCGRCSPARRQCVSSGRSILYLWAITCSYWDSQFKIKASTGAPPFLTPCYQQTPERALLLTIQYSKARHRFDDHTIHTYYNNNEDTTLSLLSIRWLIMPASPWECWSPIHGISKWPPSLAWCTVQYLMRAAISKLKYHPNWHICLQICHQQGLVDPRS